MNVLAVLKTRHSRNLFLNEAGCIFSGAGTRLLTKRFLHVGVSLQPKALMRLEDNNTRLQVNHCSGSYE
jgi:hypothetical protein